MMTRYPTCGVRRPARLHGVPRIAERIDRDELAVIRPLDTVSGVITPVVRRHYVTLDSGQLAVALGDTHVPHVTHDPAGGQGANAASRGLAVRRAARRAAAPGRHAGSGVLRPRRAAPLGSAAADCPVLQRAAPGAAARDVAVRRRDPVARRGRSLRDQLSPSRGHLGGDVQPGGRRALPDQRRVKRRLGVRIAGKNLRNQCDNSVPGQQGFR